MKLTLRLLRLPLLIVGFATFGAPVRLLIGNWILRGSGREGFEGRGRRKTKAAPLAAHTKKKALRDGLGSIR
jgi:hypothetical protein